MKSVVLLVLTGFATFVTKAQTSVPFDSPDWTATGQVVKETFKGKDGIRLTGGDLFLNDKTFRNGIIEFDMTLSKERYFPGFAFRMQDKDNFEHVYLRPHQLGNPDAIQYSPVYNGQPGWQLYYGDGYSTAVTYPIDEWIHIKLVVRDRQAEVYVDKQDKPALVIHQLKRDPQPGGISLGNGASAVTRFADFKYTKQDNPPLTGAFKPEAAPVPGTIMEWQVSDTFSEKKLGNDYAVPEELAKSLRWQSLKAENSGMLNLARANKLDEEKNTVFTKLTILSDKPQVKKLQFGFSDRARVYHNGRLVYAGQDVFTSRDYRFLGTVGYFDEVYLDLKKGKNELWIAVSETFGGWGLKMMIGDRNGLTVQ